MIGLGAPRRDRRPRVEACDDRIVEFDGHAMVSLGYSNRTPFDSPRELDEQELYRRVDALAQALDDPSRAIFNLHVPPYDSGLDTAAELDEDLSVVMSDSEPKLIPVGSTAVRELIERYQPLLGLHGHVLESAGVTRSHVHDHPDFSTLAASDRGPPPRPSLRGPAGRPCRPSAACGPSPADSRVAAGTRPRGRGATRRTPRR